MDTFNPANAKPIETVTREWFGFPPSAINPAISNEACEKIDFEKLLDTEIIVCGFSKRPGSIANAQGEKNDFAVICFVLAASPDQPKVTVTGASVILQKLQYCHDKAAWPVKGTVKRLTGKSSKMKYYDIVS